MFIEDQLPTRLKFLGVTTENMLTLWNILRENCSNTELFLVSIFPHLDWIQRGTSCLSVFSPNPGKYGPEITPYLNTFHAVADTIYKPASQMFAYQRMRKQVIKEQVLEFANTFPILFYFYTFLHYVILIVTSCTVNPSRPVLKWIKMKISLY